jgi:heme/copper-type cytochrome/quinol oxidase subunit 2
MKTWQFWVIVLVFVLVVIPFLYFAVVAKNVAKVASSVDISGNQPLETFAPTHYTK